jgi:hypothetical protein
MWEVYVPGRGGFNWDDIVVPEEEAEEEAKALVYGRVAEKPIDLSGIYPHPRPKKRKSPDRFYKISVKDSELRTVIKLKGGTTYTLRVYLAIVSQTLLTRNPTVTLPKNVALDWGLSRCTVSNGLRILEQAGIVSVMRDPGKLARITVLADSALPPPSPVAQEN